MTYDINTYEVAIVPEGETPDMSGFDVEAIDGTIGTVDEHTYDTGASYLVSRHRSMDIREESDAACGRNPRGRSRR